MKILIVGATGFIGHAMYQGLFLDGHDVVAGVRKPNAFEGKAIQIDFATIQQDKNLSQKLKGFDVVINAVGIIAPSGGQGFEQMHTIAPIALFDAAKEAGVGKIVQISALGSAKGTTPYHTSKHQADDHLKNLGVAYAILYPSVVYGANGKSTALFQALAALPYVPLIKDGTQKLQPIEISDLVATVHNVVHSNVKALELNLVGSDVVSYKELLLGFRSWLGLEATQTFSAPLIGINMIGKALGEPTVNSDNITMLDQGSTADVEPLADFLGYKPVGIKENLFGKRANHAQRLYASLYLIRPLLRWIISFVWIWSGIVSALLYPQVDALKLLHDVGIAAPIDVPILYIASVLDIGLGILTIIGYKIVKLLYFQTVVIVVYTLLLTFLAPYHWLHPFGPVLKNLPLIVTIYILALLEKNR